MPRPSVLLTLLLALPSVTAIGNELTPCTSSHEEDSGYEACYGWCSAVAAAEHCTWCKCRGCDWCAATDGGTIEAPGDDAQACSSDVEGDVDHADCQPFCNENEWRSHCGLCKCKGCGFCSCSSKHADDSTERQCQTWCSEEYYDDHCPRCKCQGCEFCAHGPPCTPSQDDDSEYEQCEEFCSADFATQHCGLCKCKGCGFCKEGLPLAATCTSGIEGDANREMCQDFCDPANRKDHCQMCKCRGCDFCACESTHENDAKVETCASWCNSNEYDTHCDWCACKGCQFCRLGGKSCQSFFATGDTDHEDCEDFCSEEASNIHCSYCKCKRCGFCKAEERKQIQAAKAAASGVAAPEAIPDGATACFSGIGHDALYEKCESFCDEAQKDEHCKLCKCKSCRVCSAVCSSGIPGDLDVMSCSSTCDAAIASAVCPTCRCRGCSFCNADGTVKDGGSSQVAVAPPVGGGSTPAEGTACVPFNSKDIDHTACHAHCSETLKGSHCETCKCKDCGFCQGFRACSSGLGHDTKWEECDPIACTGRATCNLCKCRACPDCAVSTSQPCESGIVNDANFLTCLPGICSSAHRASHCQLCGCRGCAFCDGFDIEVFASPPPPKAKCVSSALGDTDHAACWPECTPGLAHTQCALCKCAECSFCTDTPQPCASEHLADSSTATCYGWCRDIGDAASMCSFCHCWKCPFCAGVTARTAIVDSDGEACPMGAELQLLESRPYRSNSWHYEMRLRVGVWQIGATVTIDFSQALSTGAELEINTDSLEDAELIDSDSMSMRVTLGEYGDELKGFTFQFTLRGGQLSLTPSTPAIVACSNVGQLFPALPSPPPHPHIPFMRSPPPPPAVAPPTVDNLMSRARERTQCVLGGRVIMGSIWAQGTNFRGSVVFAVWKPGTEVSIDFNVAPNDDDDEEVFGHDNVLQSLHATHALHAEPLNPSPPGLLRFRLGNAADDADGFSFVARGAGGRMAKNPRLRCFLMGETNPDQVKGAGGDSKTMSASKATISPTCEPLGLSYSVLQRWAAGFKVAVAVRTWNVGAHVNVRYQSPRVQLLDQWSATRLSSTSTEGGGSELSLALGDSPDSEHHGFGFTARGVEGANEVPEITCDGIDRDAMLWMPVPMTACGMGASHSVQPQPEGGPGSFLVRVRLSQWQAGGSVTVVFTESIESKASEKSDNEPPAALEYSAAMGSQHTFELGAHPDDSHGFSFVVRSAPPVYEPAHIVRLTCKPRADELRGAVQEVIRSGSPEAPPAVKAHGTGCDSIEVVWNPAVDNGMPVTGYRIYYRRSEATDASFATLEVEMKGNNVQTRATLNGLSGGTTYYVKVRAKNAMGDGKYSVRVSANTPSGGAPKTAPSALTTLPSTDCHSIRVALPSLRPGCHGESFLSVKVRLYQSGRPWIEAVPKAAEGEARVPDLDPMGVYELQAVPHNAHGEGPPSDSSTAMMPAFDGNALAAPRVRAVGSASFSLSWADLTSTCRPKVAYRISYRDSAGEGAWSVVTTEAHGSTHLAYPVRCRSGCAFRMESGNGLVPANRRWSAPTVASAVTRNVPLPPLSAGSVRVELRLKSEQPDRDTVQMGLDAADDITSALRLDDSSAVTVHEVYGVGRYIIADVSSAVQEGARKATTATSLAQQLALFAQEDEKETWGLRAGAATKEVEAIATLDGVVATPLLATAVSKEAQEQYYRLDRWYGSGRRGGGSSTSTPLDQARSFVIVLVVLATIGWCYMSTTSAYRGGGYEAVGKA